MNLIHYPYLLILACQEDFLESDESLFNEETATYVANYHSKQ